MAWVNLKTKQNKKDAVDGKLFKKSSLTNYFQLLHQLQLEELYAYYTYNVCQTENIFWYNGYCDMYCASIPLSLSNYSFSQFAEALKLMINA